MHTRIDGSFYKELLEKGIKNLEAHMTEVNNLNVFPVPDGDTGTNMVMTLKGGFEAVRGVDGGVYEIAKRFADAAVYGARGNSGVILSQFFRGIAEGLVGLSELTAKDVSAALKSGYKKAYISVAKPVEGTMLTVMRESALAMEITPHGESLEEYFSLLLGEAKISLERTPDLLPILKKAGVIDSGGAGVVYFYEGVLAALRGEEIELSVEEEKTVELLDFSMIDRNTNFDYGYCVEGLLQLTVRESEFNFDRFRRGLEKCGSSIVATRIDDKIKLHIHSKNLADVMSHAQTAGEFLTLKIENMTVQNLQKAKGAPPTRKFLFAEEESDCDFSLVAVASSPVMQKLFYEMGVDVVMYSEIAPSSQDFMDAFGYTKKKKIIVFPNSSNSVLTSMQAGGLCRSANVTVLNCRSFAECYAALSVMDFSESAENVIAAAKDSIASLYELSVYHAAKDVKFGSKRIKKDDYFALAKNEILATDESLEDVTLKAIGNTLRDSDYGVVTVFYNEALGEEFVELLAEKIYSLGHSADVATVPIGKCGAYLTVTFE